MRWSAAHIPTLRDDPAEAEAISHRLLVRAGYIRQLSAGHYSMLPLGQRVRAKVSRIIEEEMDAIGGQRFHLPALHPAELWKKSGRWEVMGEEMFRLVDRKGAECCLGMTHEEIFALLATEMFSYRDLPQIWYQMQTKFRDEPRPKAGLLRVREFTMKDSYSLDVDQSGLDAAFEEHHRAYVRIFERFGVEAVDVEASSGAMGGSDSREFMVRSTAGEDWILTCDSCDYRANIERATSAVEAVDDPDTVGPVERFATPGIKTIKGLAEAFPGVADPERQLKSLVYMLDGQPTVAVLRGDHELQEQKLKDSMGAVELRAALPEEIEEILGARPGSLGPVGVTGVPIVMDEALRGRRGMVTGANEDDWHISSVDVDRDVDADVWADLRAIGNGETCVVDGGTLSLWKGIEVGHIFKLGTRYSEAMGATVQNESGDSVPIVMGSYGIGVERSMAAVVEASHDEKGIIWPVALAPYEVVITTMRADDEAVSEAGEDLYRRLAEAGVDVLYDDRVERPGVKFADAELIGVPFRVTIGPRGVESGSAELTPRATMETEEIALSDLVERLLERINDARS